MAKLKDLGTIITGNTPKTSDVKNYATKDIPFIKPSDIIEDEISYIYNSEFYISEHARNTARIIPVNCVLVTCIGIIGKVAINKVECAFNQQINAIIPDEKKCLSNYLIFALQSKKKNLRDIANAPVVPILNKTQFSKIEISLPSLQEQEKICFKLNKLSSLISLRKAQLSKLDELVKSRFIEIFGEPLANTKNWQTECLFSVAPTKQIAFEIKGKVWLLNLDAVESNTGTILFKNYVSKDEINTSTIMFSTDNVLYSKLRPYLNKVVLPDENGVATSELLPLLPDKKKLNNVYLCYWLRSDAFVKHISEKVAGAKMPRVSMDYFRNIEIELPPIDLQNKFATFVEQTDKLKFEVKESLEKLETLKKSLMQKYFG